MSGLRSIYILGGFRCNSSLDRPTRSFLFYSGQNSILPNTRLYQCKLLSSTANRTRLLQVYSRLWKQHDRKLNSDTTCKQKADASRRLGFRGKELLYASVVIAAGGLAYVSFGNNGPKGEDLLLAEQKPSDKKQIQKEYNKKEVSYHNSLEKGVWITYKGSVYDITNFIQHHPGGSHTIMMGAGGDVEPFWNTYTVHHADEVQKLLSTYKIGVLKEENIFGQTKDRLHDSPYADEPERSKLLIVHSKEPFNAETPSKLLVDSYITPTDIFFVRNHLPVPEIELADYKLEIHIEDRNELGKDKILASFTLDELKTKFKPHSIDAVMQCSGNRRTDLKKVSDHLYILTISIVAQIWPFVFIDNSLQLSSCSLHAQTSIAEKDERNQRIRLESGCNRQRYLDWSQVC